MQTAQITRTWCYDDLLEVIYFETGNTFGKSKNLITLTLVSQALIKGCVASGTPSCCGVTAWWKSRWSGWAGTYLISSIRISLHSTSAAVTNKSLVIGLIQNVYDWNYTQEFYIFLEKVELSWVQFYGASTQ